MQSYCHFAYSSLFYLFLGSCETKIKSSKFLLYTMIIEFPNYVLHLSTWQMKHKPTQKQGVSKLNIPTQ